MKIILAPTDFSEIAGNAIDYAVEIAVCSNAKIILFHVYHVPVVPSEIPIMMPVDEIERDSMESLKKIERKIHQKHGSKLIIECHCKYGFPVDEINFFAEENKIDLIIMGMEGTGYLTEKLIGSITTSLIRKAKCPVLAIDKEVRFKNIKKIVLASDYGEIKNKSILAPLKEFAHLFKAHVYILNVARELEIIPSVSKAVEGIKLDHLMEEINHSFYYAKNEDIIEGINDFVEEKQIDLVAMIPREHATIQSLFIEPNTKRMAFHTKVPLLALHA